jgi:5'-methylthioadenosine phosphorylase
MPVGVIGGSNVYKTPLLNNAVKKTLETPYGKAEVYVKDSLAFIPRHGSSRTTPPHRINHRANVSALRSLGAKKIIGLCMTGSLNKKIRPPAIAIPDDYISPWNIPTFYDDRIIHITPKLDEGLRRLITETARENRIKTINGGVYVQTTGPRLETKAEVRMLKNHGDIVGMTMASEATLAQELNISYAAICSVDNYAHGLSKRPLDFKKVLEESRKNTDKITRLTLKTIEKLR